MAAGGREDGRPTAWKERMMVNEKRYSLGYGEYVTKSQLDDVRMNAETAAAHASRKLKAVRYIERDLIGDHQLILVLNWAKSEGIMIDPNQAESLGFALHDIVVKAFELGARTEREGL